MQSFWRLLDVNQSIRNQKDVGAPAGIRTPNQQIMRRFEGHQQGETKRDEAVFTESAAVKVSYILLRLNTPSRHNRAILRAELFGSRNARHEHRSTGIIPIRNVLLDEQPFDDEEEHLHRQSRGESEMRVGFG